MSFSIKLEYIPKNAIKGQSLAQKNSFSIAKFQVVFEKYFKTKFI